MRGERLGIYVALAWEHILICIFTYIRNVYLLIYVLMCAMDVRRRRDGPRLHAPRVPMGPNPNL